MDGFNSRNVHFGLSAEQDGETGDTVSFLQSKEGDGSESFTNPIPGNIRSAAQTLSYTCILVPCSPSLQLLGDLANHLSQLVSRICDRHGWQLEFANIGRDYFQWGLRVNDSILPTHFVEIIRSETSELILSSLNQLTFRDPSNDLWAPGHLIFPGARPDSDDLIKRYIRLIRR